MQMDVEEKQLCLTVRWGLKSACMIDIILEV